MIHQAPQPPRPPIQYFEERIEVGPSGPAVVRVFTDYFGDDFDAYICRSMLDARQDDYEDPAILDDILAHLAEVDAEIDGIEEMGYGTAIRYSLEDVGDDGTVVVAGNPFDPDDNGADQPDPNEDDIIWSPSLPERAIRPEWMDDGDE